MEIVMAHTLHLQVVTEGVETLEQQQCLEGFGCWSCAGCWTNSTSATSHPSIRGRRVPIEMHQGRRVLLQIALPTMQTHQLRS